MYGGARVPCWLLWVSLAVLMGVWGVDACRVGYGDDCSCLIPNPTKEAATCSGGTWHVATSWTVRDWVDLHTTNVSVQGNLVLEKGSKLEFVAKGGPHAPLGSVYASQVDSVDNAELVLFVESDPRNASSNGDTFVDYLLIHSPNVVSHKVSVSVRPSYQDSGCHPLSVELVESTADGNGLGMRVTWSLDDRCGGHHAAWFWPWGAMVIFIGAIAVGLLVVLIIWWKRRKAKQKESTYSFMMLDAADEHWEL